MVISTKKIEKFLIFLFFCFLPFQDTILKNTFLGFLGYYLSILPLFILMLFLAVKKTKFVLSKNFMFYSIYILFVSIIMNIPYFYESYYSFLNYKIFSNYIIFVLFYFVAVYIGNINYNLKNYIFIAFAMNIMGFIISDCLNFNDGYIIHSDNIIYSDNLSRLRGFTSESSWYGYLIVLLGGMSACFIKKKNIKLLFIFLTVLFAICTGSKGTILCLIFSIMIFLFFKIESKKIRLYIFLTTLFFVIFLLPGLFLYLFHDDIEKYTSLATRASSIISAVDIFIHFPSGTGFGAFIPIFREYLIKDFRFFENITGLYLNSSEIEYMVLGNMDTKGVAIKSYIFQWITMFGIPFLIVLYKKVKKYFLFLYNSRDWYMFSLFSFFIFANLTYSTYSFESSVFIGFLINYCRNKQLVMEQIKIRENFIK